VFKIRMKRNQASWLFLPVFQSAMPFQAASQMINGMSQIKIDVSVGILIKLIISRFIFL